MKTDGKTNQCVLEESRFLFFFKKNFFLPQVEVAKSAPSMPQRCKQLCCLCCLFSPSSSSILLHTRALTHPPSLPHMYRSVPCLLLHEDEKTLAFPYVARCCSLVSFPLRVMEAYMRVNCACNVKASRPRHGGGNVENGNFILPVTIYGKMGYVATA